MISLTLLLSVWALVITSMCAYTLNFPKGSRKNNFVLPSASQAHFEDEDFGERKNFRSSFISILGNPNVGKSTLLNELLGERLCITSHKPQTTRHRILGVLTNDEEDYQFVFSDTPGMLKPSYALQETMVTSVRGAVGDGDIILLVTDVYGEALADEQVYRNIQSSDIPVIIAINKVDLVAGAESAGTLDCEGFENTKVEGILKKRPESVFSKLRQRKASKQILMNAKDHSQDFESGRLGGSVLDEDQIDFIMSSNQEDSKAHRERDEKLRPKGTNELVKLWSSRIPRARFVALSASKGWGLGELTQQLLSLSPQGPKFFPSDTITNRDERFFSSEIIRESILSLYSDEVPYSCEVRIDQFRDKGENLSVIDATIVVSRESQKGIIIGKQGSKLKKLGQDARARLESFLERGVYLNLHVKVDKDWRSSRESLEKYEYM